MHEHDQPNSAVHPKDRPSEPEHPMSLEGEVVMGDTGLMLRILTEELMLTGATPDALRAMSHNPEYQALFAARRTLGDAAADSILAEVAGRLGVHRHRKWESADSFHPAELTISAKQGR